MKPILGLKVRTGNVSDTNKSDWSNPIQYEVRGMPPGKVAEIARYPNPSKWSIYFRSEALKLVWKGAYETEEDALAAVALLT